MGQKLCRVAERSNRRKRDTSLGILGRGYLGILGFGYGTGFLTKNQERDTMGKGYHRMFDLYAFLYILAVHLYTP